MAKKNRNKNYTAADSEISLQGFSEHELVAEIKRLLEPYCDSEGIELVYVEYRREPSGRVLRLYIDKPGGVTLDDCVAISRGAGDLIDVYFDSNGTGGKAGYMMEVSSPGPNRPLGKLSDFERFKGRSVRIKVKPTELSPKSSKPEKLKTIHGVIEGVEGDSVKIRGVDVVQNIAYSSVARANLMNGNGESSC